MLKIFTTQLQGHFNRIMEKEEMNMEDGARILAQSVISNGSIFVHGFGEMAAVETEALFGAEPLKSAKPLFTNNKINEVEGVDSVLLITRFSTDEEAIKLAEELRGNGIQTVAISAIVKTEDERTLNKIVDIHIDSKLTKPLIPDDVGTRFGFPSVMTALYAYFGLTFTIKEMVDEFE
ncbi:DUF2529 family protein [Bacillus timonensis]|uniref:DUF2529 family protein n=1 Tax=Bacillus timonensis TaxID=1033734 RepID=A0A4S3PM72_9BACI|nr:DUF2529 domain-containing protein [Bacillus timonensis]THE10284.1 DUF2529 family protein [Bacillus timonensis]